MTSVDLVVMPSESVAPFLERSLLEVGEDIAIASDLGGPEALELAAVVNPLTRSYRRTVARGLNPW